jgi:hypothetical protein
MGPSTILTSRDIEGATTNDLRNALVDIDPGVNHTIGVHRDPLVFSGNLQ